MPFIAVDLDPGLVRTAHAAAQQVYYGDAREPDVLEVTRRSRGGDRRVIR
ncbi:MAG: hypothetical protein IPG68_04185 [Micrococcales bacterium]|nr:hypothetical protein [Micrococcales bacterium]